MVRSSLVVFLLLAAVAASAADGNGGDLLIPIAGRGPGAAGSEWRTDVVLTNLAWRSIEAPAAVTLTFSQAGHADRTVSVDVAASASVVLEDVLLRRFHVTAGAGTLRVSALPAARRIAARARIYNIGSAAGEYGDVVTALPVASLTRMQLLPALSGEGGRRTNIGVANPWDVDALVTIALYELDGGERGSFTTVVAPRSVRIWNDIFGPSGFSLQSHANVRITSSHPVYAYGSIVRNDTGDADFVAGANAADPQ